MLDVIHTIQATQAGDLAVRWNCKAGKCGSCSAEINGKPRLMCMTRMNTFTPGEPITVAPMKTFPLIRDLATDVSFNFEKAKMVPAFRPRPKEADGTRRMQQEDIERGQEFRKCIECFLCQDVCHVIRDHPENKPAFAGPRFFVRLAELEMHPLDTHDRKELIKLKAGLGFCNITKCCTEVCPEHIHITDNAIIPLKERIVTEYHDPVVWLWRKLTGKTVALPMKIHEYQAKAILREFGVPVPSGDVAETPAEARAVAQKLGGRVVVKAQVHAGGRGKAGGVKLADDPAAAEAAARQILGMMLKTPQTPPEGIKVLKVLVEEASPIATELYLSITLDRARETHVGDGLGGGRDGDRGGRRGAPREDHPRVGGSRARAPGRSRRAISPSGSGSPGDQFKSGVALIRSLFRAYLDKDCSLAEINPLVVTRDGRVLALDAKLNFDDNALYRHPGDRRSPRHQRGGAARRRGVEAQPQLHQARRQRRVHGQRRRARHGHDGHRQAGRRFARPTSSTWAAAPRPSRWRTPSASSPRIPSVKAVFINVFGGILRCDRLAAGLIAAITKLGIELPVVVRMEGHQRGAGAEDAGRVRPQLHDRRRHGPGGRQGRRAGAGAG